VSDEATPSHPGSPFWVAIRYVVGIGVGAFVLILLFGKRHEFDAALHQVRHLNIGWEGGAFAAEALSIVGYASLQHRVLDWSGATIKLRSLTMVSLANNAIAYTIPGEPAVSSVYRYRFFRRHGASAASSAWTILTILIAQAIGMSLLLLVGVLSALTGRSSANETGLAVVGLVVVVGAGTILVRRDLLLRCINLLVRGARRVTGHPRGDIAARIENALARMREIPLSRQRTLKLVAMATGLWFLDFLCLICCFGAVHAAIPWHGVLLAYGVAQITAALPLVPGGLGIVEGSLAVILVAYGAKEIPALAAVLVYRLLTFWFAVLVGWICLGIIEWQWRRSRSIPFSDGASLSVTDT